MKITLFLKQKILYIVGVLTAKAYKISIIVFKNLYFIVFLGKFSIDFNL